ncbi:hypothetical protein ABKV19_001129 [Rosa sericea]
MLDKLMEEFLCPIYRVLFPEVAEATLDFHHGSVVEEFGHFHISPLKAFAQGRVTREGKY